MSTLGKTAAAFAGLLVVILAWAAIFGDPRGGEPYAVVEVDSEARPAPDAEAEEAAEGPQGTDQAQPPSGTEEEADPDVADAPPSILPEAPEVGPGDIRLATAPVSGLFEQSRYGPLPKIAEDGRRPSQIYARPSTHSGARQEGEPARIAIVVNGLGLSELSTSKAINTLPGSVTLAYSPYGRNLQGWVTRSREAGHEVMLQIPLEPEDYPDSDPGPNTLLTNVPREENMKRLRWLMSRFTGYTGVTNLMGEKFAGEEDALIPVLEEMKARGLIFLDDGAMAGDGDGEVARGLDLDFSVAEVVIDPTRTPDTVDESLAKLEAAALEKGVAIGVANSLPITIERISEWSRSLENKGLVLVPVSAVVGEDSPS